MEVATGETAVERSDPGLRWIPGIQFCVTKRFCGIIFS